MYAVSVLTSPSASTPSSSSSPLSSLSLSSPLSSSSSILSSSSSILSASLSSSSLLSNTMSQLPQNYQSLPTFSIPSSYDSSLLTFHESPLSKLSSESSSSTSSLPWNTNSDCNRIIPEPPVIQLPISLVPGPMQNHGSVNASAPFFVSSDLQSTTSLDQFLNNFYLKEVLPRREKIARDFQTVMKPIKKVLTIVEQGEPRFKGCYYNPFDDNKTPFLETGKKRNLKACFEKYYPGHAQVTYKDPNYLPGKDGPFNSLMNLDESDSTYLASKGVLVVSNQEFEIYFYLSQLGDFFLSEADCFPPHPFPNHHFQTQQPHAGQNFDTLKEIPGTAALKLGEGRKRSMSLWVEFITASGFLSAKKMRSKFKALVVQALEKLNENDRKEIRMDESVANNSGVGVVLKVKEQFKVTVTLAFRCEHVWPRSSKIWQNSPWPPLNLAYEAKTRGFDLLSKSCSDFCRTSKPSTLFDVLTQAQNGAQATSNEDDLWQLSFDRIRSFLLHSDIARSRGDCLEILETIRDKCLTNVPGKPVERSLLENLVLYECEKRPRNESWTKDCLGERLCSILLQLLACLRNRSCPSYFDREVDLLRGKSSTNLNFASLEIWKILRHLIFLLSRNKSAA